MAQSSIEWTDATWNPTTGCDHLSPGCDHCYAETLSRRLQGMANQPKYKSDFELTLHPDTLDIPLKWKRPKNIFVNSMSDLFHVDIPVDYIQSVFSTMRAAHWHRFQILTKRSGRVLALDEQIDWPSNVWMGVSVESDRYIARIDHLRKTRAAIKFLSLEPLLGPLENLNLDGIDWVIVGGECGRSPRPMEPEWVESISLQCEAQRVPFFFKQWGGKNKKAAGRELNGRTYDDMPLVQIAS
jgi:protein gp37